MEVYTLFSGSSGNCIYLRNGEDEILFDAGRSMTMIEKALNSLGSSLSEIKAIFVTHEHTDHTYGLEIISKRYGIPVKFSQQSYFEAVKPATFLYKCASAIKEGSENEVGSLTVVPFEIPHDSKMNFGYIIKSKDGNKPFGIATDIGHVTNKLKENLMQCEGIILESNHDIKMLKSGSYPYLLKKRILSESGHLSNEDSAKLVCELANGGLKSVTLAHLSMENNTPEKAVETLHNVMKENSVSDIEISVASPVKTVCAFKEKAVNRF